MKKHKINIKLQFPIDAFDLFASNDTFFLYSAQYYLTKVMTLIGTATNKRNLLSFFYYVILVSVVVLFVVSE